MAWLLGAGLVVAMAPPAVAQPDADPQWHKVDQRVRAELAPAAAAGRPVEVLVLLEPAPVRAAGAATDEVLAGLRRHAGSTQRPVVAAIEAGGGTVAGTFWLKNMVLARVGEQTLGELTTLAEVDRIIPNLRLSVPVPPRVAEQPDGSPQEQADPYTWGLAKIGVDRVHGELGLRGDGVRVAVLDTGVDITHPDLAGKLVSTDPADPRFPGGWMEFSGTGAPVASEPHDSQTHGTHVAGTVVGGAASGTQIGVAPAAELMAGLVLPGGEGTLAQVIAGMQWAAEPFDVDGNPVGEPADVVNMSLGAVGLHDELIEPTRNLYQAGIFPSFSIGNNCFGGSSGPGNVYEAVGVGATDANDDVPAFSCGQLIQRSSWDDPPADWPATYVVPDLAAPGVSVMSAYPGGQWRSASGTSMAAPHVAGTVALMIEAAGGDLPVPAALQLLQDTSYFDERHGAERPNPRLGYGRIDAYRAVTEVAFDSGVTGTVTDAATGAPVPGATITRTDNGFAVTTDQAGRYRLTTPPGTYRLRIDRFGYESRELSGVTVTDGQLTTVDLELTARPRGNVAGRVTMAGRGATVPGATVRVLDVPEPLAATTGTSGTFSIAGVPVGSSYRIAAYLPGLPPSPAVTVELTETRIGGVELTIPLPGATELVTLGHDGTGANNYSIVPTVSRDGRFVAFRSMASNLVPGDTNGSSDVFVRDRVTGHTERISVATDGTESQGGGAFLLYPMMSDDARFVVWDDDAYNLVDGDDNQTYDVFVHDRRLRTTELVSVASDGSHADDASLDPDISGDGRFVAFRSHATNLGADPRGVGQVWVHDRQTGTTELISVGVDGLAGDGTSTRPSLSADGRYVAFASTASNLVPGDTNGRSDIFVADRVEGTIELISAGIDGVPADGNASYPVITDDGRLVTFHSAATNLVPGDTNARQDVFVHDRQTGTTTRVSVANDGSQGNGPSHYPSISPDGGYVTFYSTATNLVPDDTNGESDVFVYDLAAGTLERVSVAADGGEGIGYAQGASLSNGGEAAAFHSAAPNLVWHDDNDLTDAFLRLREPPAPVARFAVWDLTVRSGPVRPGDTVLVTAQVKNIGEAVGAYPAVLRVDGVVAAESTVELRPGAPRALVFRIRLDQPGDHELRLGAVTTTVHVG
ncbi:MAG TPA: S8 family serine peptidase [Natronosporangium sp.]